MMAFILPAALVFSIMIAGLSTWLRKSAKPSTHRHDKKDVNMKQIEFASQLGGKSLINHAYTDMPSKLLMDDMAQFVRLLWAVPYVLWPVRPCDSGDLDELSLTRQNIWCIVLHFLLVILQLVFIFIAIPAMFLLPVWAAVLGFTGFMILNHIFCLLLNGPSIHYRSDPAYAKAKPEHAREEWIFLNGVAVGDHWMRNNLNRLALTFGRPIQGIHNRTSGILFDIIECLVQRNLGYATTDVRLCYTVLKDVLYRDDIDKVVFLLHSQGGIEGGLVLDWLLQELPQTLLSKLEVYTFGNAANHFNNPHRHVHDPSAAHKPTPTDLSQPSGKIAHPRRPLALDTGDSLPRPTPDLLTETSSPRPSDLSDRVIGHIEHYAHTFDFVALWGVIHFTSTRRANASLPRFIGRVFVRASDRGGHQLCQHYLDGMFPLERAAAAGGGGGNAKGAAGWRGCAETNEFMESSVVIGREGDESADVDVAFRESWAGKVRGADGRSEDGMAEVKIHGGSPVVSRKTTGLGAVRTAKVKDLSRLWQYRNGRIPEDRSKNGTGVVRAGTV
jgi:hypothetical protein